MLRILLIDDEKPAREVIKNYLEGSAGFEIVGEAENGKKGLEAARRSRPDLVLLDVQMPVMDGIETAASLPEGTGIVFVTAYDSYAMKAFELHAFDYLLKPVMKERLLETLSRYSVAAAKIPTRTELLELFEQFRAGGKKAQSRESAAAAAYIDRLTIKTMFEYMVIKAEDISCIRAEAGLVFVYSEGVKYNYGASLKRLEEKLDPAVFLRVHRNALVNKNKVKRIAAREGNYYRVELDDGEAVDLSRDNLKRFKQDMGWEV